MSDPRPRRSALYLPATNARAVAKARMLPADVVILDLEDSVAPELKDGAREQAEAALREGGFGRREVVLRVNGLDTPWGEADLRMASAAAPDAVLVPKVNDAAEIRRYDAALATAAPATRLWAMIETARCLFRLEEIALAAENSRLALLVIGTNDLAKEMGALLLPDRAPFLGALGLAVAAARAGGIGILDGVYNDIEDAAGFDRQCRQGREFGFDGKTLIHPAQIAACNAVFTPAAEALAWARLVIETFARPENAGKGALRIEGRMVERLHLGEAARLLALQQAIDEAALPGP